MTHRNDNRSVEVINRFLDDFNEDLERKIQFLTASPHLSQEHVKSRRAQLEAMRAAIRILSIKSFRTMGGLEPSMKDLDEATASFLIAMVAFDKKKLLSLSDLENENLAAWGKSVRPETFKAEFEKLITPFEKWQLSLSGFEKVYASLLGHLFDLDEVQKKRRGAFIAARLIKNRAPDKPSLAPALSHFDHNIELLDAEIMRNLDEIRAEIVGPL